MFFCDNGSRIKEPFLYIFIVYSKLSGFSVLHWYNIFGVRLYRFFSQVGVERDPSVFCGKMHAREVDEI